MSYKFNGKRHIIKIEDFFCLCETNAGWSGGIASRSSVETRRQWDDYSTDGELAQQDFEDMFAARASDGEKAEELENSINRITNDSGQF